MQFCVPLTNTAPSVAHFATLNAAADACWNRPVRTNMKALVVFYFKVHFQRGITEKNEIETSRETVTSVLLLQGIYTERAGYVTETTALLRYPVAPRKCVCVCWPS